MQIYLHLLSIDLLLLIELASSSAKYFGQCSGARQATPCLMCEYGIVQSI